jgi:hypothetical protein
VGKSTSHHSSPTAQVPKTLPLRQNTESNKKRKFGGQQTHGEQESELVAELRKKLSISETELQRTKNQVEEKDYQLEQKSDRIVALELRLTTSDS